METTIKKFACGILIYSIEIAMAFTQTVNTTSILAQGALMNNTATASGDNAIAAAGGIAIISTETQSGTQSGTKKINSTISSGKFTSYSKANRKETACAAAICIIESNERR